MPFACVSFCLSTLTNDGRIFIAAESIADRFYSLPYGWDAAYEVKPIGNRILYWVFYKIANVFVPFTANDYFWFGVAVKVCGLVILLICCGYISRRIGLKNPYTFPLLVLAFACQANFGIMMSEWFSVLFSLVAIALCFEPDKRWTFAAGALCVAIALLKGITVFMVIPAVCAVYLLGGSIDWKRAITGFFTASVVFISLCATVWPYQIMDILMSGHVAHVGHYSVTTLLTYFWMTQTGMTLPIFLSTYIPVILCGAAISVILILRYFSKLQYRDLGFFLLMWAIPALIVIIQSEFIGYHYLVFVLPAIVTFFIFMDFWPRALVVTEGCLVFLIATFIIFNSFFGSYSVYENGFWQMKERNADILNNEFNLSNQSEILYLDPGDGAYYFHANSSCRYITPMPVERNQPPEWNMTGWPQYADNRQCILAYQGEYILTDVSTGSQFSYTFFQDPDIAAMIARNYTKVDNKSWDVFRRIS